MCSIKQKPPLKMIRREVTYAFLGFALSRRIFVRSKPELTTVKNLNLRDDFGLTVKSLGLGDCYLI